MLIAGVRLIVGSSEPNQVEDAAKFVDRSFDWWRELVMGYDNANSYSDQEPYKLGRKLPQWIIDSKVPHECGAAYI